MGKTTWFHKGYFRENNDKSCSMIYHNTEVFNLSNKIVTLRNDGFKTKTTLKRINEAFDLSCLSSWCIFQKDFVWYVRTGAGKAIEFKDGMKISVKTGQVI